MWLTQPEQITASQYLLFYSCFAHLELKQLKILREFKESMLWMFQFLKSDQPTAADTNQQQWSATFFPGVSLNTRRRVFAICIFHWSSTEVTFHTPCKTTCAPQLYTHTLNKQPAHGAATEEAPEHTNTFVTGLGFSFLLCSTIKSELLSLYHFKHVVP